jgi:integrase
MHADGGGLYLTIAPSGSRSWIFRYQRHGKRRDMGLGPVHLVGLAEARRRAHACREMLFQGIDPLGRKQGQRAAEAVETAKAITFQGCAEKYIEAHKAGWRHPKSLSQWQGSLGMHVYPAIGSLPAAAIDTALVLKVLEPIWTTRTETASRVRGRIESVLDWATTRGHRAGENPARWKGHLENLLPKPGRVRGVEHHPALPYQEIAAFMARLRQLDGADARALEFVVLTAARRAEVLGARWQEINLAERLWIVPPERMKAHKEHRVPLSDAAMALLGQPGEGFVFVGRKGRHLPDKAMLQVLGRMGRPDLTVHGFRSTFADWAAERTAYPFEVRELALAHTVGDAVVRAYQRSDLFDRRRRLMDDWARYCAMPAATTGEVVAIGAA